MKNVSSFKPLVVITGPTATGKSRVGALVAEKTNGEIVSADSMLIYRGMDIGTAKPTEAERRGIPHYMIDIIEPDQEYSVALYQVQARTVIDDIHQRKKLPFLVGGTGLYINSVISNYSFSGIKGDSSIRDALIKEAISGGPGLLHRKLSVVDPEAASRLHPGDTRRIIRALEVHYLTGKPISYHHKADEQKSPYNHVILGLTLDREKLYMRIEHRVESMINSGLVDEVRGLLERGYSPELNSMRGLGYKEIISYLKGDLTLDQAVEVLKRNTRRFAKRQHTWFRRYKDIKWFDIEKHGGYEAVAQEITKHVEGVFQGL